MDALLGRSRRTREGLFLIEYVGHLKRLSFVDLDIEEETIFPAICPPLFPTSIEMLEIKHTKWPTIALLLPYLSPTKVTLEGCYFDRPSPIPVKLPSSVTHLSLSHLSEYATHPLVEVLWNWARGIELTFHSSEFLSNGFRLLLLS
ncbi:hypothetical protein DFP72DRAFT_1058215 [Ephemerocybe angulata]|uniref:Uncharacterized protein n=1 Tax=Ephemerocybe angulata TaxID=980116 RepID=A0A8H6MEI6_9AGAR|nr:hypothetical protein DFP72DRAFT_1058215 [Tulosesus angulatus]